MKAFLTSWQVWALGSAVFAALTAIFAKIGITEVNSDFATFVRTVVILLALALMLTLAGNWQAPASVPARSWIFLVLSGLATGASWLCYFRALQIGKAAQVARSTSSPSFWSPSSPSCSSASSFPRPIGWPF
ncbi:hypothetical protein GCM10023069_00030 [Shinella granuli]